MAKTQFPASHHTGISTKRLLGAALGLLIFFLLMMSVIRLGEKYFAVRNRNKELATQSADLQQKENTLISTNAYLSSPEGAEQSLRERYNYVKPGEGMIVIMPETPLADPAAHQSIIVRWWDELLHGLGIRKQS
ncbi:MAG: hypothetical protein JWM92_457 [Candidatus Nomurabacteria bacterium]|jgi:cell division protein FtsB|nr:hypothetical protein [Candidatus Nomurabacteria bacterium]